MYTNHYFHHGYAFILRKLGIAPDKASKVYSDDISGHNEQSQLLMEVGNTAA
jgi:hypothetical protein